MINHEDENDNLAISKYESMLKQNQVHFFDSNEFESIINHYINTGALDKAKTAISLAMSQHPNSSSLCILQAEMFIIEDDLVSAEKLLDELELANPNQEDVLIQRANIFSKRGKHHDAIRLLKEALEVSQEKGEVYNILGVEHLFIDDLENAKEYFIKSLKINPTEHSALYNVMYCFDYLEQTTQAIAFLNEFLDNNPYAEIAWYQTGKQYIKQKQYKRALAAFDFAIISDDQFTGAYIEKGKTLEKLKYYDKALQSYQDCIVLDASLTYAWVRIGYCYEKLNQPKKALDTYLDTLKNDTTYDKLWIAIVRFFIQKKDLYKALKYINQAIAITDKHPEYWRLYAIIQMQLNKPLEAEHAFEKCCKYGDTSVEIWVDRADILHYLKEPYVALQWLEESLEHHPKHPEILYRLAGFLFQTRRVNEGKKILSYALQQDFEYHFILEELFPVIFNTKMIQQIINTYRE